MWIMSIATAGAMNPSNNGLRVWVNGELAEPGEKRISVTDHGLIVGDGVFEALKVTSAGGFAVTRHLDRLSRSAEALGLPAPDHDQLRAGIEAVLAGRDWELGKIRITYTGGEGPLGSPPAFGPVTVVVASSPAEAPDAVTQIVTTPWLRNEAGAMTGVKTTSYAENVRGLKYALDRDASEGIFVNTAGNVSEGTGSNIFFVFGDEIVTPPMSAGPLAGITRAVVGEWCRITERDLTLDRAQQADEVFITSSTRDVQSVDRWDDAVFPASGPVTKQVAQTFAVRSEADIDP